MPIAEPTSTILVVEDETLVRMYGADLLEDAGFDVLEAADADEALAILNNHDAVHVLFSDVDMPGSMDGLELAHLVQQRWPHIRLLLTSGNHQLSRDGLPPKGQFVRKPWTQEILVERIREVLKG